MPEHMQAGPAMPPNKRVQKSKMEKDSLRADLSNAMGEDEHYGYQYWDKIIAEYDRSAGPWLKKASRVGKVLRNDNAQKTDPRSKYNITKSVFETLSPAIFSRLPRPDVSRRYRDVDPAARVASLLLERTMEYELLHYCDFKAAMQNVVMDYLQCGRGTVFLRYEPHIRAKELDQPTDGLELTSDQDEGMEELDLEKTTIDFVLYSDFGHNVARTWEEVHTVWRIIYLEEEAVKARFGDAMAERVPYDTQPKLNEMAFGDDDQKRANEMAKIYEVWCKHTKKVYWISKSVGKILDVKDDPLHLEEFFPCPKPLTMNITTQSLFPEPMYYYFKDQAVSLSILAERQRKLIDMLRIRGVFNASIKELSGLFSEGLDGDLIPCSDWAGLSEKGGLQGAFEMVDLTPIANSLTTSFQATEAIKNQIYDITGISDILRGVSDPSETATAQVLKSTNAQGRLKNHQLAIVEFATSILKLKAQIICEHYEDSSIMQMAGAPLLSEQDKQLIPQALQILRDESLRGFRVEVSSDSMVLLDELQEKTDRLEFIGAIGAYLEKAQPIISNAPELAPLVTELMKFGAAAFKGGKVMEGLVDEIADQARQQAEQMRNQPKPPPADIQKLQMEQQADQQKFQAEQQAEAQKMQAKMQFDREVLQMNMQAEQQKAQLQMQVEQSKQEMQAREVAASNELEAQRHQFEKELEERIEEQRRAHEMTMMQQQEMFKRNTAIALELIKGNNKIDVEQIKAALDTGEPEQEVNSEMLNGALDSPFAPLVKSIQDSHKETQAQMGQLMEAVTRPKRVVRGPDGKISEVH